MRFIKITLQFFLIALSSITFGQNTIVLQKKVKANKQKILKTNRQYEFKTTDTVYCSNIVSFTDSALSITYLKKSDEIGQYAYKVNGKDTVYRYNKYISDTISIPFSKIVSIKKDWFKDRRCLEFFAMLGIGAGTVIAPIAAVASGDTEGVKETVATTAIMFSICATTVFIVTRATTYGLKNKWDLTSR